jgi:hypothetical protein
MKLISLPLKHRTGVQLMKTIKMLIELTYDDKIMHGDDVKEKEWFYNEILLCKENTLRLHDNEIGDDIGDVRVVEILK